VPKRAPALAAHSHAIPAPHSPTAPSTSARPHSRRSTSADLLPRVFALDVPTCPHCGGPRRRIAGSLSQRRRSILAIRRCAVNQGLPHRPRRRAQAPRASRSLDQASKARTLPLARRARLRLSRHPRAAEHAPRRRVCAVVSKAPAPPPRAARQPHKPGPSKRRPGLGGHMTDARSAPNLHLAVDDVRRRRSTSTAHAGLVRCAAPSSGTPRLALAMERGLASRAKRVQAVARALWERAGLFSGAGGGRWVCSAGQGQRLGRSRTVRGSALKQVPARGVEAPWAVRDARGSCPHNWVGELCDEATWAALVKDR
jgi:hypothetical protein